jgi:hypothetical protein
MDLNFQLSSINDTIYYILFLEFLTALCIFIYGRYRCKHKTFIDPFQKKIKILDLDGWSILHLVQNSVLGYLFPDYIIFIIILGVMWEVFEMYYGVFRPTFLEGWGHCSSDRKIWWYGKLTDIVSNILGVFMGSYIKTH